MTQTQKQLLQQYHDSVDSYLGSTVGREKNTDLKENDVKLITDSFKRKGLKIRYGRWNIQEKRLLHRNFEEFVRLHADVIGNPVDFIKPSEDRGRAHVVKQLKTELEFLLCLSKGLYRERSIIASHMRHTLDPLAISNGQKYSVEDLHMLKSLVDKHGRNWKTISKEMGRSNVSLQSAHRNFFLHDGYTREPPTKKQQRKLVKEIERLYPDTDFTCEVAKNIPWNSIANKIGFMHGKYLCDFWEGKVKYRDEDGKLLLKPVGKIPAKLIRKFIKHATKQKPTHLDALDWNYYVRMFAGYTPGTFLLRQLIPRMLRQYKINETEIGLPKAMKQLSIYVKRTKRLGFQSIWEEIKADSIKRFRWQQFHWALSPDLAHYIHQSPVMYWGYAEDHSDVTEIKEEPLDIDVVW